MRMLSQLSVLDWERLHELFDTSYWHIYQLSFEQLDVGASCIMSWLFLCAFRQVEELWSRAVWAGFCVSVPEVSLCDGAVHPEDDVPGLGLRMLQGASLSGSLVCHPLSPSSSSEVSLTCLKGHILCKNPFFLYLRAYIWVCQTSTNSKTPLSSLLPLYLCLTLIGKWEVETLSLLLFALLWTLNLTITYMVNLIKGIDELPMLYQYFV